MQILLGLTNRCNAKCNYCPVRDLEKYEGAKPVSTDEFKNVLEQIVNLYIPKETLIVFIGGEPLIRKDYVELISYANKLGLGTHLDTNGILLSKDKVDQLKEAGLNGVSISIDTDIPEEYDRVKRCPGGFEKAINAIKMCVEKGIFTILSTRYTKESIYSGSLVRVIQLALNLNVDKVSLFEPIDPISESGFISDLNKGVLPEFDLLKEEDLHKLAEVLLPYKDLKGPRINEEFIYFENRYSYIDELKTYRGYCPCFSKKQFSITWYGDVVPCVANILSFGNIREKPLEDILEDMWNHEIFKFNIDNPLFIKHDVFKFDVPPGCLGKYEDQLIKTQPKYTNLFKKIKGFPKKVFD